MITINLLAPGKRRPVGLTTGTIAAIASIAAVILVFVAASVYLTSRVASLHRQMTDVSRQIEGLRPIAAEVARLDQMVKSLETRQIALRELLGRQLPAAESLEAIKRVIPSDVWLVNVATQSNGHNVLFDGYTFTYKSVARFMVALRDSDRFRNIDLTSTSKDRVGDREVVKFQVTGELAGEPKAGDAPARPGIPALHASSRIGDPR
jgi:Tfp pilus assembly protein PilN